MCEVAFGDAGAMGEWCSLVFSGRRPCVIAHTSPCAAPMVCQTGSQRCQEDRVPTVPLVLALIPLQRCRIVLTGNVTLQLLGLCEC